MFFGQNTRDGGLGGTSPSPEAPTAHEEVPLRSSREYPRAAGTGPEPLQTQLPRSGSLRSNPPSSWRQDGRPQRVDDYASGDRRSPKQPRRQNVGSARFAEPGGPEVPEADFEHYSRPNVGIRNSRTGDYERVPGQHTRYAEDYSDAERGYPTRLSGDSRRLDDNPPLTRESEKPLNSSAKTPVPRPAFGRTFTQAFRENEPVGAMDFKHMSNEERKEVIKLPWYYLMDTNFKNHIVAALGELVGTTLFLFFAFAGTAVANIPAGTGDSNTTTAGDTGFSIDVQLYIALAFGFSLMVNVWVFYRISGGLFNPAVCSSTP